MKNILISFILLASFSSSLYSQISITESDIPTDPIVLNLKISNSTGITNPVEGADILWDYRYIEGNDLQIELKDATMFSFIMADLYRENIYEDISNGKGYYYNEYYFEDNEMLSINGIIIPEQKNDISSLTLTKGDSFNFPNQVIYYQSPNTIYKYPLEMGTSWNLDYSESVEFKLYVKMYGYSNTTGNRLRYIKKDYNVVGWGSVILPADTHFSRKTEVLMIKEQSIKTDSFFVNGIAAPNLLLSGFGLTQGQQTIENNYHLIRKGHISPVMTFQYGSNNFTKLEQVLFDSDMEKSSIDEPLQQINVFHFENQLHIDLDIPFQLNIYDLSGKSVLNFNNCSENNISTQNLNSGYYLVEIEAKGYSKQYLKILVN